MISEVTDSVILDYVPDALGSVHSVIDQDANVVKTMRYKPYGEVLSRSGTVADRHYQWVGSYGYRATFAPSSSHYVRARHYSATAGSWSTVDPLWPDESAYGYVRGRASHGIDFLGLADGIGSLPTCTCKPKPKITGLWPKKEGSRLNCYLRACAKYCAATEDTDVGNAAKECSPPQICIGFNQQLPPCTAKDGLIFRECGQFYTDPGGGGYNGAPANESNYPLPAPQVFPALCPPRYGAPMPPVCMIGSSLCCVECKMRVCCRDLRDKRDAWEGMVKSWWKCDGK